MTDEIKIEKGIPVPNKRFKVTGKNYKYPYPDMDVGDSFFVVPKGTTLTPLQSTLSSGSQRFAKNTNRKFTTRIVTENGVTGVRVWRVG